MNYENIYNQYMYSYPHKTSYQQIGRLNLKEYNLDIAQYPIGLYFHIPFCDSKCGYCNLFSIPIGKQNKIDSYISAIERHSTQLKQELDIKNSRFSSLVFGGGTPLILSVTQLNALFELAIKDYQIDLEQTFVVIETSPNQTTKEKLDYLYDKNTNRVSIGVQSFVQKEIEVIQRMHSVNSAHKALELIKTYDFENTNIDLIYGIPNQTIDTLLYSAKVALTYDPDEIFVYPLYQKPNTKIYGNFVIKRQLQYKMYLEVSAYLKSHGYFQTSMRRFVKVKPQVNLSCGFENMISLGCGGRTYLNNIHFCESYTSHPSKCIKQLQNYIQKQDFFQGINTYILNEEEQKRRFIIKNLLYHSGISIVDYKVIFDKDPEHDFELLNKGWVKRTNTHIKLTDKGMSLSDYIGPMLISNTVKQQMEKYAND
ncbi:coproporphyrinogen III oxidase, anaerobic [Anaerovirgula multivorans]|uniref:Heme chaperone HemW n=1 Tax=Anaerovirgula multivorans TaxID=312168 RepID=A0A239L3K7_9FIRM|nr:STM4012 family radical SAM protein [Anaerovirgula multivorans]SNT24900.1 coproporphyrinogen III oxidase, anaerobic [Anaerovirgula multivorans]